MNEDLLLAVLGMLGGGSLLAIVNKFLNRNTDKYDLATKIREELRIDIKRYQDEVNGLRTEILALHQEVVDWKNKYYDLLKSQGVLEIANSDLKADVIRLTQILKDYNIKDYNIN